MQTTSRLPKALQRITEVAIALIAVVTLLVLIAVVFTGEGLDVPVQFTPNEDTYELSSDDWGSATILSSEGLARFDQRDLSLVAVFTTAVVVSSVPWLIVLILLRKIFQTMAAGHPFADQNAPRIRWIGILVIVFGVLTQLIQWTATWLAMNTLDASGLHLETRISPDLAIVFVGLVIIALAEVFAHGSRLQTESDLTV